MTQAIGATREDFRHMARALQLAEQGLYSTRPNPRVGCVLVKDGTVIGEGWHVYAGGPHAEVEALRQAGGRARGAACYVTLEPCCHHGRTPPCTEALIAAGVARVVAAAGDPNPEVAGRGLRALEQAGIAVQTGILAEAAEALNAGFFKRMRTGRPYVRAKAGMSLDGRVAAANGESQWITSAASRHDVQRLRALSGAVMTGIGTVLADDPLLTVREPEYLNRLHEQPWRAVLDPDLEFPPTARMLGVPGRTLIFTTRGRAQAADALRARGAEVIGVEGDERALDLQAVLSELGRREVNEVLVESGPTLTGALLAAGLADELICYVAPVLLGAQALGVARLEGFERLADAVKLDIADVRQCGPDLRITARPGRE